MIKKGKGLELEEEKTPPKVTAQTADQTTAGGNSSNQGEHLPAHPLLPNPPTGSQDSETKRPKTPGPPNPRKFPHKQPGNFFRLTTVFVAKNSTYQELIQSYNSDNGGILPFPGFHQL